MTILNYSEMPMSFQGAALLYGAKTDILNPRNEGQSNLNRYVGKPLRAVARLIYQLAVILIGPGAAVYHVTRATIYKIKSLLVINQVFQNKYSILAWEHLKASCHDALSLTLFSNFAFQPNQAVPNYLSGSLVLTENNRPPVRFDHYTFAKLSYRERPDVDFEVILNVVNQNNH